MEVSRQFHVSAALSGGKVPRYPLDKNPVGHYSIVTAVASRSDCVMH